MSHGTAPTATLAAAMLEDQKRWYADELPLADAVVADVGANVGELSELFWQQAGAGGRVVSIEPLRSNVRALEERIRHAATTRWTVEPCACSDREGELVLAPAKLAYGYNASIDHGSAPGPTIRVACRRLIDLVPAATVVKLDIEGHEYAVLDDALDGPTPMATVRAWALELHMRKARPLQGVLAQLARHGYALLAAGRGRDDPQGPWRSVPILPTLGWEAIPAAPSDDEGANGRPVKMLHVIARR
jgi:FkbM family methyltransferase